MCGTDDRFSSSVNSGFLVAPDRPQIPMVCPTESSGCPPAIVPLSEPRLPAHRRRSHRGLRRRGDFARRGYGRRSRLDSEGGGAARRAGHQHRKPGAGAARSCAGRGRADRARLAGSGARMVFKKIDSTLRGNVGTEVRWPADAFGARRPSSRPPSGHGSDGGSGLPARRGAEHAPSRWRRSGARRGWSARTFRRKTCMRRSNQAGARFISVDAASDRDLDTLRLRALVGAAYPLGRVGGPGFGAGPTLPWGRTPGPGPCRRHGPPAGLFRALSASARITPSPSNSSAI